MCFQVMRGVSACCRFHCYTDLIVLTRKCVSKLSALSVLVADLTAIWNEPFLQENVFPNYALSQCFLQIQLLIRI